MRQLKISQKPPNPAWAAKNANALPFLQQLATARPLGVEPVSEEQLMRFLVSMATQYRNQGYYIDETEPLLAEH